MMDRCQKHCRWSASTPPPPPAAEGIQQQGGRGRVPGRAGRALSEPLGNRGHGAAQLEPWLAWAAVTCQTAELLLAPPGRCPGVEQGGLPGSPAELAPWPPVWEVPFLGGRPVGHWCSTSTCGCRTEGG